MHLDQELVPVPLDTPGVPEAIARGRAAHAAHCPQPCDCIETIEARAIVTVTSTDDVDGIPNGMAVTRRPLVTVDHRRP